MKNINKLMLTCMMLTLGSLNIEAAKNIAGSSSATWAPRRFTPSEEFMEPGMVGNYFESSSVATIHNPSTSDGSGHSFKNVGFEHERGSTLIGTYSETVSAANSCQLDYKLLQITNPEKASRIRVGCSSEGDGVSENIERNLYGIKTD